MATITSANSIVTLTVPGLFNFPVQLQGFATDQAYDAEATENAEVKLGVDGIMSVGWIPRITKVTYSLQADSPSGFLFENWIAAEDQAQDKFIANGLTLVPGISRKYTMTRGVMSSAVAFPGAKKTLEMRNFIITWNTIQPGPM